MRGGSDRRRAPRAGRRADPRSGKQADPGILTRRRELRRIRPTKIGPMEVGPHETITRALTGLHRRGRCRACGRTSRYRAENDLKPGRTRTDASG